MNVRTMTAEERDRLKLAEMEEFLPSDDAPFLESLRRVREKVAEWDRKKADEHNGGGQ